METYRFHWTVYVKNEPWASGFFTGIWRDTAERAESAVRLRYPAAEIVCAEPNPETAQD